MARPNEDDNQFGIASVHVIDDEKITDGGLAHPVPPGGALPDLKLATFPNINVASGTSFQPMPDLPKPPIIWPDLSGSPDRGGVDDSNPSSPAPGLAGVDDGYSFPADGAIHQPDYAQPDFASLNCNLIGGSDDIAQANINWSYGGEFNADPLVPDLTDYNKPYGLDFYPESYANLWAPDPTLDGDATNYEVPGGIHVVNDPQDPDPSVPDLQNPQFQLAVQMSGRPGDMDPGAFDVLNNSPDVQGLSNVSYDISPMVQPGSTRRSRHMSLLTDGLT